MCVLLSTLAAGPDEYEYVSDCSQGGVGCVDESTGCRQGDTYDHRNKSLAPPSGDSIKCFFCFFLFETRFSGECVNHASFRGTNDNRHWSADTRPCPCRADPRRGKCYVGPGSLHTLAGRA